MSKHIKGKLKIINDTMLFARSIGGCQMQEDDFLFADVRGWGHLQYHGEEKGFEIQKANAQELCRRWNAFEEGGSHKALLEACKDGLKFLDSMTSGIGLTSEKQNKTAFKRIIEKAIAQAEGKVE
jgi:hypothetical protein